MTADHKPCGAVGTRLDARAVTQALVEASFRRIDSISSNKLSDALIYIY
jgi:hypothetical protein